MTKLYIDLETYCAVDLKRAGAYRYAEDPTFEILMCAWSSDGETVHLAQGEDEIAQIPGLFDPDVLKIAHNASFERVCLSALAGFPVGEYLPIDSFFDTQALAGERGYRQKLEWLAPQLGAVEKDSAGTRLINLFSKPNSKGVRTFASDKPKEWQEFCDYCIQDVYTLIDVHDRLGGALTLTDNRTWLADQYINDTGVAIDVEMADAAIEQDAINKRRGLAAMKKLTHLENPNSVQQLGGWLLQQGCPLPNLRAETVRQAMKRDDTPPIVKEALQHRVDLALTTSSKYEAAQLSVCSDGRVRGMFRFYGAHTGRWAGRGLQLHNLTRSSVGNALETEQAIEALKLGLGCNPQTLKGLIRSLLVGPFTVVDFSAIEARVVAWLAGEQWVLDAFDQGRDIYVETAERMGGGMTRAHGKIAVLALGYNGGIGSLKAMGAPGDDGTLQEIVNRWRATNPAIVKLWKLMDSRFATGGSVGEFLTVEKDGSDRYIRLPSGRAIGYHRCKRTADGRVTFESSQRNKVRSDTYGGRLIENVTQAVARDLLAEALIRLLEHDERVVAHVHDEILVEGADDDSVRRVSEIMCATPGWAEGLPVGGEGFTAYRYRK